MESKRLFLSKKHHNKEEKKTEPQKDLTLLSQQKLTKYNLNELYLKLTPLENLIGLKPVSNYMNFQNEINEKMRLILIDWIISIHNDFKFLDRTLYQTVWIIDTFLSLNSIKVSKLQLVGATSLLISCKFNEFQCPKIETIVALSGNAFTSEDLLLMEVKILKDINYNLIIPTLDEFYNIISNFFNFNQEEFLLGKFFMESSILNYEFIRYSISDIILGCAFIVLVIIENKKNICHFKKNTKDIAKKIYIFVENLENMVNINAVDEKHSKEKYYLKIKGIF